MPDPGEPDEEPQRLDPRSIRVHEIGLTIFVGILLTANLVGIGISAIAEGGRRWLLFAITAAASIALAGLCWWLARRWAHKTYRHTTYIVGARGLEIRRGVWWRHTIAVPRSRIQHADVSQGPVQRAFELGTLVLYTAGAQLAKIELDGLAFSTALALRQDLLRGESPASQASPAASMPSASVDDDDDELE